MEATVVLGRLPISNPRWCATGFVVGRYEGTQDGNEKFSTYLITNRHVVENEEKNGDAGKSPKWRKGILALPGFRK